MIQTPVPSSEMLQFQKTLDNAINQGVVGILQILAVTALLLSFALVIYLWTRRNKKPQSADMDAAFTTMAKIVDRLNTQLESLQERQLKSEEANRQLFKEISERNVEGMAAFSDSNNRMADNQMALTGLLKRITDGNDGQSASVKQLLEVGSKPVQTIAGKVADIEHAVNEILTKIITRDEFKELFEADRQKFENWFQGMKIDVEIVKRNLELCIEEKRKGDTGENKTVESTAAAPEPAL